MRKRLLGACMLVYPKARRRADGGYLLDLALEFSETNGLAREAYSLLIGGLRSRIAWRRRSIGARLVLVGFAGLVGVLALGSVVAVTGSSNTDVEVRTCVTRSGTDDAAVCADLKRMAAAGQHDGWQCATVHQHADGHRVVSFECRRDS